MTSLPANIQLFLTSELTVPSEGIADAVGGSVATFYRYWRNRLEGPCWAPLVLDAVLDARPTFCY